MEGKKSLVYSLILTTILVFLLIGIVRSIQDNRVSLKRLTDAQKDLDNIVLTNDQLKNDIEFAKTDEYLEKAAFEHLNMTKPDYTVVVLEEKKTVDDIRAETQSSDIPKISNWKLWAIAFKLYSQ